MSKRTILDFIQSGSATKQPRLSTTEEGGHALGLDNSDTLSRYSLS